MPTAPTMPRVSTGLMLTVLLHLALLYALLRSSPTPMVTVPRRAQPPIQWLRLLPLPRLAPPSITSSSHAPNKPNKPTTSPSAAAPTATPSATTHSEPITVPQNAIPAEPPTPDLTAPVPPAQRSMADILQQARHDLAGIDRELRKEHPERGISPPPDSKQAKLERGFEAAHAAVLPKWYEAATMEEITGADNRTRIYRVKSALGMFCIWIDQEGHKKYTTCPQ